MPYAPTDRFALTAKGVRALAAREQVKDCRALLPEHEPPCGACDACRELYDIDNDDGREEGDPRDGCAPAVGCYDDAPF